MPTVEMQENLGKALRTAREAANLTVDDAVYRGRIPRAVVEALEEDDIGFFTSPLYARSFLKQYGDYVGVDVSPWIDDLVPTALIDCEAVESFLDLSATDPEPVARVKEKSRDSGGGGAMAAVWLILITGGLAWLGIGYFRKLDEKLSAVPPPVQQAPPAPAQEEAEPPVEEENPVAIAEPEAPKRAIIVNLPDE